MISLGSIAFKVAEVSGSYFTPTASSPAWFTVGSIDIGFASLSDPGIG